MKYLTNSGLSYFLNKIKAYLTSSTYLNSIGISNSEIDDIADDAGYSSGSLPASEDIFITGDIIPNTDNSVDLGASSKNFKMIYTKGITINGTQFLPSNFVDVSTAQTIGGIKTFSNAPVVGSINLDGKTIDTDANGNMTFNSHIVDTIEEQGNEYIRYSNGIQICWGKITWQSACVNAWGSLYETTGSPVGSYAKSFVQLPSVSVYAYGIGEFGGIIESVGGSTTLIPYFWLCRASRISDVKTCSVSYIAIGRWK